jgi:hypothetical protein
LNKIVTKANATILPEAEKAKTAVEDSVNDLNKRMAELSPVEDQF